MTSLPDLGHIPPMHCAPSFLAIASVALLAAPAMAQVSGGAEVSGSVSIGTAPPPPPPAAQPTPPPPPPVYAPAPPQPTYVAQPGYYPPPPPPPPPRDLHAREHDGFYFRGALGGGYLGTTGEVAGRAGPEIKISGGGLALDLAFGGTVARGLVIGGDLFFQQAVKPKIEYGTFSGTTESNVNFLVLGPMIDWFPNPFGGFHVSATLGLAGLSVSDQNGNTQGNERGFGASFGTGYDFWISDQWSLGILGRFSGGSVRSSDTGGIYAKDSVGTFSVLFSVLNH